MPYLTNETLFSLTELPRRLAIIGAGPIGCEMAQCFARFGSDAPRGYGVEIVIEVADVVALYESARGFAEIAAPLERRPWGARDFRVLDPFGFYLRITELLSG